MGAGYEFECDACDFTFEAWDDGNPYFLDADGTRHYAYHPDVDCERCNRCRSKRIVDAVDAAGHRCPRCKRGVIHEDTSAGMIS